MYEYPELAQFILQQIKDNKKRDNLSEPLLKELTVIPQDILASMKTVVAKDPDDWKPVIKQMLNTDGSYLQTLGARFASTRIVENETTIYYKLKTLIKSLDEDTDFRVKCWMAAAIFYFKAFDEDSCFKKKIDDFYKRTIDRQIPIFLENFRGPGAIEASRQFLENELKNPIKKNKKGVTQLFLNNLPQGIQCL